MSLMIEAPTAFQTQGLPNGFRQGELSEEAVTQMRTAQVEPYTVPRPDEVGLENFYEFVRHDPVTNPKGLKDGIFLAIAEPLAREGETLEGVMARFGEEYLHMVASPDYQRGPSEIAFYESHYVPPKLDEPLVASSDRRSVRDLFWHALAIRDKNEQEVAVGSLTHIALKKRYAAPGCRYKPWFGWDTSRINHGNAALRDVVRLREGVENTADVIDETGHLANSGNVFIGTRPHPIGVGLDVMLLAGLEGQQVYEEFLPAMIKNWRTRTADRDQLRDVPLDTRKTHGATTIMEDGSFLVAAGTDFVGGPRHESFAEDLKLARELVRHLGLTGVAAEIAMEEFYDEMRGGAAQATDFMGSQCRDGKSLITISTRKRLSVRVNSALAFDAYVIARTLRGMGHTQEARFFFKDAWQTTAAVNRWLHDGSIYLDRYADTDDFAEPDASMVDPLLYGLADERHGAGVVQHLEDYVHAGGIDPTLNDAPMNWRRDGSFAMTANPVINGLHRFGHAVGGVVGAQALSLGNRARWGFLNGYAVNFRETGTIREQISARTPEVSILSGGEQDEYETLDEFVPAGMEWVAQAIVDPRDPRNLGFLTIRGLTSAR